MGDQPVAVVVGVGAGLGAALARRFAREGYAVALVARSAKSLDPVQAVIEAEQGTALAVPADATDAAAVEAAFATIRESLGAPEVLIYNAGAFGMAGIVEIDPKDFERAWRVNCFGAFLCARQVIPGMLAAGRGTVLLTGATGSLRGGARFSQLAVGKFGLRALAQSMARELHPQGVHVAHVVIDGQIDGPVARQWFPDRESHTLLQPDAIAGVYWSLHTQDRTTWTQELDIRPAVEKF